MSTSAAALESPAIAAGEAVVAARGVTRRYGQGEAAVEALRGIDLDFARARFTSIMGPSGSGKSTLLHVLAGLDRPTAGIVEIDGVDITRMGDRALTMLRRERIGFVFQAFNLLPVLDAIENIRLPLTIARRPVDPEWERRLVEEVGLGKRLHHRPAELSGGEQQRVAIARALITRPAVVFADEPTGNLDSTSSTAILELMRRSVDEFGQAIVMVTHDARAAAYTDRIVFVRDGLVVDDHGAMPVADIYAHIAALE